MLQITESTQTESQAQTILDTADAYNISAGYYKEDGYKVVFEVGAGKEAQNWNKLRKELIKLKLIN